MENLKNRLLQHFKKNKNIISTSYKEIKEDINNSTLTDLCNNYKVHIYELSFYHSELKEFI